jgi:hypothetical protein
VKPAEWVVAVAAVAADFRELATSGEAAADDLERRPAGTT